MTISFWVGVLVGMVLTIVTCVIVMTAMVIVEERSWVNGKVHP